jgi:hypothetical protein
MSESGCPKGSIFQIIASIFRKHSVQPVLVGGYALNAYKVQRMTFDIDFILTGEAYIRIEHDILSLGYTVFNRTEAFIQLRNESSGLRDIDFLISDQETMRRLIATGTQMNIAGEDFFVPSLAYLTAMEQQSFSRNNDGPDLPVSKKNMEPPSVRSMDEIDRWIEEDYALFFDRAEYDKLKKLYAVPVRFSLQ